MNYYSYVVYSEPDAFLKIKVELLDEAQDVQELIDISQQHWLESEPGGQDHILITDENGSLVCTLTHGKTWNECITSYTDGRRELHHIEYELDVDGKYLRTNIERVPHGWQSVGTSVN